MSKTTLVWKGRTYGLGTGAGQKIAGSFGPEHLKSRTKPKQQAQAGLHRDNRSSPSVRQKPDLLRDLRAHPERAARRAILVVISGM